MGLYSRMTLLVVAVGLSSIPAFGADEAVLRPIPFRRWVGHFTGGQRCGIERNFARISRAGTVLQKLQEFLPAQDRELLTRLPSLGGDVRLQGLSSVVP